MSRTLKRKAVKMISMFEDFLPCNVYKNGTDCTNGGISSRTDTLYLCRDYVTPTAVKEYCEANNEDIEKFVITETRFICGREYKNIKLVCEDNHRHEVGGMSGGNMLYTCDARWEKITGCPYPLSIHDRYETQELYEALSR